GLNGSASTTLGCGEPGWWPAEFCRLVQKIIFAPDDPETIFCVAGNDIPHAVAATLVGQCRPACDSHAQGLSKRYGPSLSFAGAVRRTARAGCRAGGCCIGKLCLVGITETVGLECHAASVLLLAYGFGARSGHRSGKPGRTSRWRRSESHREFADR